MQRIVLGVRAPVRNPNISWASIDCVDESVEPRAYISAFGTKYLVYRNKNWDKLDSAERLIFVLRHGQPLQMDWADDFIAFKCGTFSS